MAVRKVLVAGGHTFGKLFPLVNHDVSYVNALSLPPHMKGNLQDYDLVVLTGGPDVDPEFYGHKKLPKTSSPSTARDEAEQDLFHRCASLGVAIVGVCRGAQILNVLNGGWIVQHVENHTRNHMITTKEGNHVYVSSTHHQMMVPSSDAIWESWAEGLSNVYEYDKKFKPKFPLSSNGKPKEPETVYYPYTQSLCIQWHPEYMRREDEAYTYFRELMVRYIWSEK